VQHVSHIVFRNRDVGWAADHGSFGKALASWRSVSRRSARRGIPRCIVNSIVPSTPGRGTERGQPTTEALSMLGFSALGTPGHSSMHCQQHSAEHARERDGERTADNRSIVNAWFLGTRFLAPGLVTVFCGGWGTGSNSSPMCVHFHSSQQSFGEHLATGHSGAPQPQRVNGLFKMVLCKYYNTDDWMRSRIRRCRSLRSRIQVQVLMSHLSASSLLSGIDSTPLLRKRTPQRCLKNEKACMPRISRIRMMCPESRVTSLSAMVLLVRLRAWCVRALVGRCDGSICQRSCWCVRTPGAFAGP
jgi:hypothetical protein